MKSKKRKNKIKITVAIFLILFGLGINIYDLYNVCKLNEKEEQSVEKFFVQTEEKQTTVVNKTKETKSKEKQEVIDYIAVLEIPKIKLKRGLVSTDSYLNNVNYNIEIIKPFSMPDEKYGNMILASHSGSSRVAFFDDLDLLSLKDDIYIYYNQKKYHYKVINEFERFNDGTMLVPKNPRETILTLVTCSKKNDENQLYIVATQVSSENY